MIQLTVKEMLDSMESLRELSQRSMTGRLAFQLARILREIDKEYNLFQESRTNLIKKYADYDENGQVKQDEQGNVLLKKSEINNFNTDLQELIATTITINSDPISAEQIYDQAFTPQQMMVLLPFINEKTPL